MIRRPDAPRPPSSLPAVVPSALTALRAGIPLTLLLDLGEPDGPPSRQILLEELVADDVRRASLLAQTLAPELARKGECLGLPRLPGASSA